MTKYLIGIEGGATKSKCAVADLNGKIITETKGKPSNLLVSGVEQAALNLFELIEACLEKIDAGFDEVQQIVIGSAGAGRSEHAGQLKNGLIKYAAGRNINLNSVVVVSDAMITLEGAFPDKPGCILICGTGSVLFGRDDKNIIHRVGGFGRLIGDEGSGYSIGRKGLNAVAKNLDQRGEATELSKILKDNFSINSADELIKRVYDEKFDISSFAESVIYAAGRGDKISAKILDEEADEIIVLMKTILKKLSVSKTRIVFTGSLINYENFYSNMIKEKMKKILPGIKAVKPAGTPVAGAIQIAKKLTLSSGKE